MEVVGITQDDAGAHGAKLVRGDGLYRGLRADRHEDRRLNITAARMEEACASLAGGVGLEKGEGREMTHRNE
jgi:hypothetical protein